MRDIDDFIAETLQDDRYRRRQGVMERLGRATVRVLDAGAVALGSMKGVPVERDVIYKDTSPEGFRRFGYAGAAVLIFTANGALDATYGINPLFATLDVLT